MDKPAESKQKLTVCVCTRGRPRMLGRCLQSLFEQKIPDDVAVSILVVDNEPSFEACEIVRLARRGGIFPVGYIAEPRRGIPFARNTALAAADGCGADWIAFIDDDEIACPNWISSLMAIEYRKAPILRGRVEYYLPDQDCFWSIRRHTRVPKHDEGEVLRTAATNNVRFTMQIVQDGLRFNENIGLGAGEDTQFFAEAISRGYQIKYTDRAITYEIIHPERLEYISQCYRAYVESASVSRIRVYIEADSRIIFYRLLTSPFMIVFGLAELAASPFMAMIHIELFKEVALRGGRRIARVLGMYAGILNCVPTAYQQTVGA